MGMFQNRQRFQSGSAGGDGRVTADSMLANHSGERWLHNEKRIIDCQLHHIFYVISFDNNNVV
jgi:hypothetical protein